MRDITSLLDRCRAMGAVLTASEGRLIIQAPKPLPDEVVEALRNAKAEILAELNREPVKDYQFSPLEDWRNSALPKWKRILKESVKSHDLEQSRYAYWMLTEFLEDPEYEEKL